MRTVLFHGNIRNTSPIMMSLSGLSHQETRQLVGNGMHVPVFAALLAYVFSNVRRREGLDPMASRRFIGIYEVDVEEDDADEDASSAPEALITEKDDDSSAPSTEKDSGKRKELGMTMTETEQALRAAQIGMALDKASSSSSQPANIYQSEDLE